MRDEIPVFLSSNDLSSPDFNSYLVNYDKIAADDLSTSIQDPYYLQLQNKKFRSYVGTVNGMDICEVGVGQGHLMRELLIDTPKSAVGVDISTEYLQNLKAIDGLELIVANAENLPFREQFDMLVAADVLEHVLNPGDFLVSVNRALRSGGRFVVKVPYRENLVQYSKRLGCPYNFVHLRSFDCPTLHELLEYAGFEVEKTYYDGFLPIRVRKFISKRKHLKERFDRWVKSLDNQFQVGETNPLVARMLMRPLEITVVATRRRAL